MKKPYKHSELIAPNTYRTLFENLLGQVTEEIQFYDTVIICKTNDHMELSHGDWMTATTKDRLNKYLPNGYSVKQRDGAWYLSYNNKLSLFVNGMSVLLSVPCISCGGLRDVEALKCSNC